MQSRTSACGMAPSTFRVSLHTSVKLIQKILYKHAQRFVTAMMLDLDPATLVMDASITWLVMDANHLNPQWGGSAAPVILILPPKGPLGFRLSMHFWFLMSHDQRDLWLCPRMPKHVGQTSQLCWYKEMGRQDWKARQGDRVVLGEKAL